MKNSHFQLITLGNTNYRITPRKPNVWTGTALILISFLMLWRSIVISLTGDFFFGSFTNCVIPVCVVAVYMFARNSKSICVWFNGFFGIGKKQELTYMPQNRPSKQSTNELGVCAGINMIVTTHNTQKSKEIRTWMQHIRENEGQQND